MVAHYAYPNVGVICWHCSSIMSPDVALSFKDETNWRYIVYCGNPKCPHFEKRYLLPKSAAFELEEVHADR